MHKFQETNKQKNVWVCANQMVAHRPLRYTGLTEL